MKCPRKLLAVSVTIGLALAALLALRAQEMYGQGAGQEPAQQTQDPRARIHTTVSLVVVPVTVKDSAGELVTDLQENDFRVFEDGVEQPIALFSADAFPLSAAILIDDDLKTRHGAKSSEDPRDPGGRVQRFRRSVPVALR